jgi:ribulose-phosphate 3-epimerase
MTIQKSTDRILLILMLNTHFVLSFDLLLQYPQAFLDVHLMVSDPMSYVKPMADAGVNLFTFHIESDMPEGGIQALIDAIKGAGMQVGLTLKPGTPVEDITPYGEQVDLFLVMTVEPGFSGQSFKADMMGKVRALRDKFPDKNISVDGGLSPKTVDAATVAGANVIVSASAIFGSDDRGAVIQRLRQSVENGGKQ